MSIPSFPINQDRLSRIIKSEFELWVNSFGKGTVTAAQELRAFFVQWVAVFAPECFDHSLVEKISTFVSRAKRHADFRSKTWYELLPIEIALYALSSDPYWVRTAQLNLNHHNSTLRDMVQESLLLVVDRIRFDDAEWLARVTDNLASWHGGSVDTVLFLCMAQGDSETKKTQITRWLDQGNMSPQDREKLEAFSSHWFARNPFLYKTTRSACYILLRLASREVPHERQLELPIISVETIWRRMTNHPIFQPFVYLRNDEK